jgi:hypothetical protein
MTLPNFLIIGAAKSGTTAISQFLAQHPQIYMSSIKEPYYFSLEEAPTFCGPGDQEAFCTAVTDIESYLQLFHEVSGEIAIGEASTTYLYIPQASKRIFTHIPKVKLIAILRNPVDRAYASFLHQRREGREPVVEFSKALQLEEKRIQKNWMPLWHYKQCGFYFIQLKRYYDLFNQDQIKVYLYEDFKNDPNGLLKNIFDFLNVDQDFSPDTSIRYNASGIPKSKLLHSLISQKSLMKTALKPLFPKSLRQKIRMKNLAKPELKPELRSQLQKTYRKDILKLQNLIKRDLGHWLE